jgi:Cu/Ag efflux pump CusA
VAALNGVVLVAAVNRLRDQGQALRAAIIAGAGTRLRPVLMTALVASFGFVPMALSHGAGAGIQRPLGRRACKPSCCASWKNRASGAVARRMTFASTSG